MNRRLQAKLRDIAKKLRDMNDEGTSVEEIREFKEDALNDYYKMICIHLGEPPKEFYWQWRDKDNEFHRHGTITPKQFYDEYVGFDLDQMVCLINAPTKDKPYNKMYTVQYLGNVVEGHDIRYLNVPIEVMEKTASKMVKDGKPVWFGADAGKMSYRDKGVFDMGIYEYDKVYGTDFSLDKAARLDYGYSKMTHAMVFTGVDMDEEEKPRRWRVENSWGTEVGDKGFYTMNNEWFTEYVYEVMVERSYLKKELLDVLKTEPVKLNPWDPMGALA
jgi:bleomycin hydrolase